MGFCGVTHEATEWPGSLDVPALLASGFRPRPFREFVLKLTARCDLACDYCYVFELADQGWHGKPARMSREIFRLAADRIAEHVARHRLDDVDVVLHGGEPLLYGADGLAEAATTVRAALPGDVRLGLRLQTNGLRLDEAMLSLLDAHQVRIGVSMDGARTHHDRHRRAPDGRGSWDAVRAAVQRLASDHPQRYAGLLCTIDIRNEPVETYEALVALRPPTIDLLLPLATWAAPPPGVPDPTDPARPTPYGDWLVAVFDRWYPVAARETGIRFFEELIQLVLGGRSRVETLGLSPAAVVVIDTDGSIEQVDTLRVAYDGAADARLDVRRDALNAALTHPGILARQLGTLALCTQCLECPLHLVCGAGYYPHRYRPGSGFLNPSVYCHDLKRLIRHVRDRVVTDLRRLIAAAAPPATP
jgi:uncharacterized protein